MFFLPCRLPLHMVVHSVSDAGFYLISSSTLFFPAIKQIFFHIQVSFVEIFLFFYVVFLSPTQICSIRAKQVTKVVYIYIYIYVFEYLTIQARCSIYHCITIVLICGFCFLFRWVFNNSFGIFC
jgi:hypothetical protein